LGGGAWTLVEPLAISGAANGSDLESAVSYAGLQSQYTPWPARGGSIRLGLLIGAGSAKVSLPIVGTELAADNFGVVEPEIVGVLPLRSFAALRAQVGYRLAYGVEDLPQVDAKYLRGETVTVSLSLGPF
jgi:hypothetical protein